eukprot:519146_1
MLQFVKSSDIPSVDTNHLLQCNVPSLTLNHKKYCTVFGAISINFIIGGYIAVGNFIPYLASYLTASEFGYNISLCTEAVQHAYASNTAICTWILTALTLGMSLFASIGGLLQLYVTTRTITILGGSIIVLQYLYTWYNPANIYVIISCSFGVLYGVGCGLIWPPTTACAMRWFPNNKALLTGVLMSAIVFGSICYSLIETLFINPMNINNDELCGYALHPQIIEKIPDTFLLLAAFCAVCTVCSALLFDKPEPEAKNVMDVSNALVSEICTLKQAVGSAQFWIMFSNVLCNMYVLSFVYSDWKLFAQNYLLIEDDAFLLSLNIAAAICNLCGRIVWGSYYDYFKSYKLSMVTITSIMCLFIMSLPLCRGVSNLMTFVWICVLWFCCAATYTFLPPALSDTFGDKYCAVLTGFIMTSEIVACGLQSGVFSVMQNVTDGTDKWFIICFVNSMFVAISCGIAFLFKTPKWVKSLAIMDKDACV